MKKSDINNEFDLPFLLALNQITGLGPVNLQKTLQLFNNHAEACFNASFSDFQQRQVPPKISQLILEQRTELSPEKIVRQLAREEIQILTSWDNDYPSILKEIYAAPLVLCFRGQREQLKILAQKNYLSLAIVGSRKISTYGKQVMAELLPKLVKEKIIIVSGLAFGVDSLAHWLTLENQGQAWAVVGSGLAWDYLYPQGNKRLAEKILENNGLIFSEFPPFTKALPYNFPRRNRIISGLSQAVLIIEASLKSGALITARYALEQNREVLAIPGQITASNSQGTNYLIKNGARLISSTEDLFDALEIIYQPQKGLVNFNAEQATPDELTVIKILSSSPLHIDKIIEHCTLETAQANSLLLQLELKGWVKNLGGQNYISLI